MKERFEGLAGQRLLVEALRAQRIVEHNDKLARLLATGGSLKEFSPGEELTRQGEQTNDVFFILQGEVGVFVNQRNVATRGAGESIGEMSVVDSAAPRSATVTASTPTVALQVSESVFQDALNANPESWRAVARVASERLRQREKTIYRPPNQEPILFIGCASESLQIAQEIQAILKFDRIEVRLWTDGIFGPSTATVDELLNALEEADFAAFIFTKDDKVVSRGHESDAPRDNVVFELGMAMGRLNRSRTFIIKEHNTDIKFPSDLLGLTPITYVFSKNSSLKVMLGPSCTELRNAIRKIGIR